MVPSDVGRCACASVCIFGKSDVVRCDCAEAAEGDVSECIDSDVVSLGADAVHHSSYLTDGCGDPAICDCCSVRLPVVVVCVVGTGCSAHSSGSYLCDAVSSEYSVLRAEAGVTSSCLGALIVAS